MKRVTDFFDPVDGAAESLGVALELNKDKPVLLLLSGGSALAVPDRLPASVFGSDLTIAMIDERWSSDATANNFAQLAALGFYERRAAAGATFFDSRPLVDEAAAALASRFEMFLQTWRAANPDGKVIVTLGMGTDGHTAGIFPGYVKALDSAGEWVAAYEVPASVNPYAIRVTVTPRFLTNETDAAVALVMGNEKRAVLEHVTATTDPETYPAALWHLMLNITVVTDKALP